LDLYLTDDNSKLRSELRELKKAVFVNAADGDAYTQDPQDVLDGPNVGWDAINKLAEEQNPSPLTTAPPATAMDRKDAPPVREDGRSELAKRVKLARSTDLWCLSPFKLYQ
jgi:hypothetical protein